MHIGFTNYFFINCFNIFSNKVQINSCLTLIATDKTIINELQTAEIFNHHSSTVTDSQEIHACDVGLLPTVDIQDPVEKAIKKYDDHSSICKIKEKFKKTHKFEFRDVSIDEIATQIRVVKTKEASFVVSLPARILKQSADVFNVAI